MGFDRLRVGLRAIALGLAMLLVPVGSFGQDRGKIPRIGYLSPSSRAAGKRSYEAFRQGLRDLGYVEGPKLAIEWRFADGRYDRLPDLAVELTRLKVDIIVAGGTPATLAAKRATSTIPIVMTGSGDPVGSGLVTSLARPGGNITGTSLLSPELATKRLDLLKAAFPRIVRVVILWNPANPVEKPILEEVIRAAPKLGVQPQPLKVASPTDLE